MKYQRKPIIVDAFQMIEGPTAPIQELQENETPQPMELGDYTTPSSWPKWLQEAWTIGRVKPMQQGAKPYELCRVITLRGPLTVFRYNYIVKIDDGEFDVYQSKMFEKHFAKHEGEESADDRNVVHPGGNNSQRT